jgi:hypothetical protein
MDGDLKETNGNILTLRLFCHRLYIIPRPPYQSTLASKELGETTNQRLHEVFPRVLSIVHYFLEFIPSGRDVYSNQALGQFSRNAF